MNNKDLFESMNNIDDKLITEATKAKSKKTVIIKFVSVAASICLIAAATLIIFISQPKTVIYNGNEFSFSKGLISDFSLDMDVKSKELTKDEILKISNGILTSGYGHFNKSNNLIAIETKTADYSITIAKSGKYISDTIIEGKEHINTVNNIEIKSGYFVTDANSRGEKTVICYSAFKKDGYTIYIECSDDSTNENDVMTKNAELCNIFTKLTFDFSDIAY